jgi:hypothetical protein
MNFCFRVRSCRTITEKPLSFNLWTLYMGLNSNLTYICISLPCGGRAVMALLRSPWSHHARFCFFSGSHCHMCIWLGWLPSSGFVHWVSASSGCSGLSLALALPSSSLKEVCTHNGMAQSDFTATPVCRSELLQFKIRTPHASVGFYSFSPALEKRTCLESDIKLYWKILSPKSTI